VSAPEKYITAFENASIFSQPPAGRGPSVPAHKILTCLIVQHPAKRPYCLPADARAVKHE